MDKAKLRSKYAQIGHHLLWFSNAYAFDDPKDNDNSYNFWWGPCEMKAAPIDEDARIVRERSDDESAMRFTKKDIEDLVSIIFVKDYAVWNFPILLENSKNNLPDFFWPPPCPPHHGTR